jgi:transmembrane sensor
MNEELNTYQVLITRLLSGEASKTDRMQLDQWLSEAPENRLLFEQYKAAWEYKPADTDHIYINRKAAWQRINMGIESIEQEQGKKVSNRAGSLRRIIYYRISGVAAMLLVLLGIYILFLNQDQPEMLTYDSKDIPSEPFTLSDGTLVQLNCSSSLTYPAEFKEKKRDVKMNGQAFFEVAHIKDKPFTIELDGASVTVLGTSFSISQSEKSRVIEVAVISGKVVLQTADNLRQELILTQGEKGIYDKVSNILKKESITNHNFIAWKTGRLEFDQTSLPEVFETIGATYRLDVIAEQDFSDLKLTARFIDEDPADIFKTIGMLFGLEVYHEPGIYTIRQQ